MTGMILDEYMDCHPEEYSRMIAAYVIGFSVTRRFMSANPHLRFAEREDEPAWWSRGTRRGRIT